MYYYDEDYYLDDYDYLDELLEEAYLEGLYDAYLNEKFKPKYDERDPGEVISFAEKGKTAKSIYAFQFITAIASHINYKHPEKQYPKYVKECKAHNIEPVTENEFNKLYSEYKRLQRNDSITGGILDLPIAGIGTAYDAIYKTPKRREQVLSKNKIV